MPEGQQPRGVTPRPRSGAAAKSARLRRRRNGREELPHVRGQGQQPRGVTLCLRSGAALGEATPRPRSGGCMGAGGPRGGIILRSRSVPLPSSKHFLVDYFIGFS